MPGLTAEAPARAVGRYQLDTEVGRLSPAERAARGKAARAQVPRDSHAVFDPPSDRPDPIALLEQQAETRVPELVPVRWGRMMVSPFTYYRGAALPMASDLAITPVSGLAVQACGDAHLSNFGLFGSAERRLVFDVNDFDETCPARGNGMSSGWRPAWRSPVRQRFQPRARGSLIAAVSRYRRAMREFASMTNLDVWYARADVTGAGTGSGSQLRAGCAWTRAVAGREPGTCRNYQQPDGRRPPRIISITAPGSDRRTGARADRPGGYQPDGP
jgi:hypothetical protein